MPSTASSSSSATSASSPSSDSSDSSASSACSAISASSSSSAISSRSGPVCPSGLPLFVVIKCGSGPAEAVSLSMDIDRDRMTGHLHPKWQDLENWILMERFLFSHKTMMRKRGENPYGLFTHITYKNWTG